MVSREITPEHIKVVMLIFMQFHEFLTSPWTLASAKRILILDVTSLKSKLRDWQGCVPPAASGENLFLCIF